MSKTIFTKVSPKAVKGIRQPYAASGASVYAVLDPQTGLATVAVTKPGDGSPRERRRSAEACAGA